MDNKQSAILINTGNILNYDFIQTKGLLDPIEEIYECIQNVCNNSMEQVKIIERKTSTIYSLQKESIDSKPIDQTKLKLSIKLFFYPDEAQSNELLAEAIEMIIHSLQTNYIDNLIISIQTNNTDNVVHYLKYYLETNITNFIEQKIVRSLGISDLDYNQLKDLCDDGQKLKPTSIQINLDACCDIPEDLSKLAKSNGIQLLTHNDPIHDYLPVNKINIVLNNLKMNDNNCLKEILKKTKTVTRRWIARYTLIQTGQGILSSKGYLVALNI